MRPQPIDEVNVRAALPVVAGPLDEIVLVE
jgi:hypothetical protein